MDDFLNKKYVLTWSENLKAIGLNKTTQDLAMSLRPVIELERNGDEYAFSTTTPFSKSVSCFKLGEEFEKTKLDGRVSKVVITVDGCTMLEVERDGASIEWSFASEDVRAIVRFNGAIAKCVFTAL